MADALNKFYKYFFKFNLGCWKSKYFKSDKEKELAKKKLD
jgi:hypothetical protein